jgi:DNA-binding beta-propeller fold protein YncE
MNTTRELSRRPAVFFSFFFFLLFSFSACGARAAQAQREILPTGMWITPLAAKGTVLQPLKPGLPNLPDFVASMGVTSRVSPDGKTLLVVTAGYNQNYDAGGNTIADASNEYVFVYDISSKTPRQVQVLQVSVSAFEGLEWNPNGREFYVSGGPDDLVHVFRRKAGRWTEGTVIQLNHNGLGLGLYGITPIASGLGVTANGRYLLAANFQNDSVSFVELASGAVVKEFDLRPGKINPADAGKPGGSYPYAIAVGGNSRAYVTSQRDREVVVLDISALPSVSVVARVHLAGQPNKAMLNHSQNRLFVALDNADAVAMIDTKSNRLVSNIQTIAPKNLFRNPQNLHGASPNNLEISSDDKTLYVTNSGTNSVAVIALRTAATSADRGPSGGEIIGLIPTAWYPTAVSVTQDQSMLYVVNGKSLPGANPKACIDRAYVHGNTAKCTSENQYIYQIMQASLAAIPMPQTGDLAMLTKQVANNNHFGTIRKPAAAEGASTQSLMGFLHSKIHHVIYVVKENKTYDQVLGDLEKGNGDPSLEVFPEAITPNHHGLARQFVTLDNTYCSGEVSGDGWNWSGAARVTESEQKTIQMDYSGRANIYDYDGTNRYINVGYATVAERQAANPETPDDPDLLAGVRDVDSHDGPEDEAGTGYLWDAALRARLTVRNYGFEYIDENRYFLDPSDPNLIKPMRSPYREGVIVSRATKPSLMPNTDPYFFDWDMDIPDYWLYREWEREFDEYVKNDNLPNLEMIALPHDHFGNLGADTVLDGVNTIETQMADNDYALALLVQKVARSKYRDDTVIFVIEDDAQDGPDHVDAHRTIAYVIGAYVKQGEVVSARYTTVNMLRTIEDLLGMAPLGLNDGLQPPMSAVFTTEFKKWDYTPIVPGVLRTTKLPLPPRTAENQLPESELRQARPAHDGAYWAAKMQGFDFKRSDHLDAGRFNRVLWEGMRGEDVPYPATRSGLDLSRNRARVLPGETTDATAAEGHRR